MLNSLALLLSYTRVCFGLMVDKGTFGADQNILFLEFGDLRCVLKTFLSFLSAWKCYEQLIVKRGEKDCNNIYVFYVSEIIAYKLSTHCLVRAKEVALDTR